MVQFRIKVVHFGKVIDKLVDSIQTSPLFFPKFRLAQFCRDIIANNLIFDGKLWVKTVEYGALNNLTIKGQS